MTDFLIDLASYQDGIDLAKVKAAGVTKVNVKLSQGTSYQWSKAGQYIAAAKALGLGVCTFHWLDNSAPGAVQARIVVDLMRRYDAFDGCAHQCDCEDTSKPATYAIWRDYTNAMQDALGRHIAAYTGDWWWQPRGWDGNTVTPYLWAGPNNGYLNDYPGDSATHWRAGYGGWDNYSLLQYAVQPIGGAGGGNLSKTAIRDPAVWAALTGKDADMLDDERKALFDIQTRVKWIDGREAAQADGTPDYVDPSGKGHPNQSTRGLAAMHADLKGLGDTISTLRTELAAIAATVAKLSQPVVNIDAAALANLPKPPTAADVADELAKRIGNG